MKTTTKIARRREGWRKVLAIAPPAAPLPPRPVPAARPLALAPALAARLGTGEVASRSELGRVLGYTRARITQLMNLLLLAPDIQEQILFTESEPRQEPFTERVLRDVARADDWNEQRRRWAATIRATSPAPGRLVR